MDSDLSQTKQQFQSFPSLVQKLEVQLTDIKCAPYKRVFEKDSPSEIHPFTAEKFREHWTNLSGDCFFISLLQVITVWWQAVVLQRLALFVRDWAELIFPQYKDN